MATRRRGRPRKLENPKPFVLRLPETLYEKVQEAAERENVSMNDVIVGALERWASVSDDDGK